MEEIKRKTEFQNASLQLQAVEKLYSEVKKKKPKGQLLSSSTPEFTELKALWQYTSSDQGLVARRSSQLWIQLLKEQCADFVYVLNGFLNQVPTAKHLYGILEAISEMLMLQVVLMETAGEKYKCPYEIRTPPHPYITVITNRPTESWPLILEQVDRLFSHAELSVQRNGFTMLDPFMKFVLLDPKCTDQYSRLRWSMKVRLVNLVSRMDSGQLRNKHLKYLIDLLYKMQGHQRVPIIIPEAAKTGMKFISSGLVRKEVGINLESPYLFATTGENVFRVYDALSDNCQKADLKYPERITCTMLRKYMATVTQIASAEDIVETGDFIVQLLYLYGNHTDDLDLCHGKKLGAYALEMLQIYQTKNMDSYSLTQAMLHLCKVKPVVLSTDENIAVLGQVILLASPTDNVGLLQIAKVILKNGADTVTPLCAGFVSMAAINVIATPQTVTMATHHKLMTSLASEILSLIDGYTAQSSVDDSSPLYSNLLSRLGYQARVFVRLAHTFTTDIAALKKWLMTVQRHIARMQTVPPLLTALLVSVLLQSPDTETSLLAIDRLSDLVKCDPTQGLYLLPVHLFVLGRASCPTVKLHTLSALPKLATHKFNVAPVLKTILNLGQSPKLKSLSIKLLTELWALQDRCFPHLLKAVSETGKGSVTMATVVDDVTLAKAVAIKEICRLRPEQHGAEMLGPLSELLNASVDDHSGPVAALCLEALYYVCESEVIDIMSAWRVLEAQLTSDSRRVVMVKVCELLSLVPSLQVKSEEYEVFLLESVHRLWLYAQRSDGMVVSAAYKALSKYSQDLFRISHFQYQIVKELVEQAEKVLEQSENEDDTIDTVMPFVPGVCYTRLLAEVKETTVTGFTDFLSALVAKEVDNLPRGIYYESLRQSARAANHGKEVVEIPSFIQSQYEKTKQPGLRPSLAVALLFCYDPQVEVGRDGRPRKHYVITYGKNYQQTFNALLQDVPVQPSDWYRTSQMGQAWMVFVDRLFAAMLQARRAEIDLQLNRDFIDEKEADGKKVSAWLWVRDNIVETIKKSTKSNPSAQFNAVLSLSGLVRSTQRYVSSLDVEEKKRLDDVTEHASHSHWLMMIIDSLMSLVDFTYMPKSALIGLCQQRSTDDRLPASVLAQAASVLALCQIASVIVSNCVELVYQLLDILIEWLPRQQTDEECPPVLYFFRSYALGVILEQLVSENFTEIAGSKGSLAVWKALDKLEECCLSQHEHRTGALLGLAACLGSICQDGKTESRVHVPAIYNKLKETVIGTPVDDSNFQPLCTCLGLVTGSGFMFNILDKGALDEVISVMEKYMESNSENAGVCRALGVLCYAAEAGGLTTIGQFKLKLYSDWMKSVASQDSSELERVASLSGLVSLFGCSKLSTKDEVKPSSDASVDILVKCLKNLLTSSGLVGIQATASWLLGNMYMSSSSTNYNSTSAPSTYSYLKESSVVRAVIDFLIQAGRQGPEFICSNHVEICLKSLQREVTGILPPLNWMGILSPLMKLPFGECVKLLCIELTIKLCGSSPSAALFLASWIVPPLFNTLNAKCRCLLLLSANHYMKTITPGVLQTFFDKSCKPSFTTSASFGENSTGSTEGRALKLAVLKGLNSALAVSDPPESVSAILFDMVDFVFKQTEKEKDEEVMLYTSTCLKHVPDTLLDKLTTGDCVDRESVSRGTFTRAFLVSNGHQPVALLNSCIDAAFNFECDRDKVLWYLAHCFYQMRSLEGTKSPMMHWVQWLNEISGHCRNIALGKFKLECDATDISKITRFLVSIIASAICFWTSKSEAALLLGLNSDLLSDPSSGCKNVFDWIDSCLMAGKKEVDWLCDVRPLECLPSRIENLTVEPWVQILQKIMDWHTSMLETADNITSKDVKLKLNESLNGLRHSQEFSRLAVWTKTVMFTL